ncbi:hypothetical protein FQN54_009036 [Arachnomyces sp. PD_36]|nr:hypothetical protein FQN54_009036 [Arachnomyces sp. PD_36]
MADRRSGSYDGEVKEASVSIGGQKIDSKTAQQLSSSGQNAQDKRIENKANKSLDKAAALVAADAERKAGKKGESSK